MGPRLTCCRPYDERAWDDIGRGWAKVLGTLTQRGDLDRATAAAAMGEILEAATPPPVQIAGFIVALRMKRRAAADELTGLVNAMLERSGCP